MMTMRRGLLAILLAVALTVPTGVVLAQPGDDAAPTEDAADLRVKDLEVTPQAPAPGDNVSFAATIENAGDANASAFNVTFHVDGQPLGDAIELAGLDAGNETLVTSANWTATTGEHQVRVHVDPDNAVREDDERNNVETEELEIEASEEDDEAEMDDPENGTEDRDRDRAFRSSFNETNGTYTGDHVAFTADEDLPGITGYTLLAEDAVLFDEITLPGDNATDTTAHRDRFTMETDDGELMLEDSERYRLGLDAEDGNATIAVADGVNVTQNTTWSDDDDAVYELRVGNTTLYLFGDGLSYENGTFTVTDDARLGTAFPPAEDRDERHEEARERMEERREEMRDRMREAGSRYDRTNDTFTGNHVVFTLDTDLPGITNVTLVKNDTALFDEIALPNSSDEENETEWRAHGVAFRLETDDGELRVLDTPTAVMVVEGEEDAPATLTLADGVHAERVDRADEGDEDDDEDDRAVYRLTLADNRTAWLAGDGLTLDNGTFTVNDTAHLRVIPAFGEASNKGPGSLPDEARGPDDDDDDERGPPEHARAHAMGRQARMQVEQAIAAGNVTVEVHVNENDTEPVALELGHVKVRRAFADPQGEVKAGVQIEAPDGAPGTVVTLNLNASDLGDLTVADAAESLAVEFDNETIEPADDLQDVLDWKDDEGQAEYLLLVGGDKVQVLVSVPHFSPHTIEVTEASTQSSEPAGNATPGVGIVGLVGVLSLAALARVTRKED